MSTLLDIATRALHDDFSGAKYNTAARNAIRTAIGMIYRGAPLARGDYVPSPVTIAAGALGVTLPDEGLRISTVTILDTGQPLEETTVDDIAVAQQLPGATPGVPNRYAVTSAGLTTTGVTLVVAPIPDRTYTLQIVGSFAPDATALDDDTDVIPLPAAYEDMLVSYARSELFALEQDTQMSDFHLSRFNGRLAQLNADLATRTLTPRRTPSMWAPSSRGPRFHRPGLF